MRERHLTTSPACDVYCVVSMTKRQHRAASNYQKLRRADFVIRGDPQCSGQKGPIPEISGKTTVRESGNPGIRESRIVCRRRPHLSRVKSSHTIRLREFQPNSITENCHEYVRFSEHAWHTEFESDDCRSSFHDPVVGRRVPLHQARSRRTLADAARRRALRDRGGAGRGMTDLLAAEKTVVARSGALRAVRLPRHRKL